MTTKNNELCGNKLRMSPVALGVVNGYGDGGRLLVVAGGRPVLAPLRALWCARVVARCSEKKGHEGKCKSSKVKLEVESITWWK